MSALFGANGAGKTNLMEAVSMLSPGRGLRGTEFSELVRQTPDGSGRARRGWALSADVRKLRRRSPSIAGCRYPWSSTSTAGPNAPPGSMASRPRRAILAS